MLIGECIIASREISVCKIWNYNKYSNSRKNGRVVVFYHIELARGERRVRRDRRSVFPGRRIKEEEKMAATSASLLKSSLVLDKSEWVKGQTQTLLLRQPSVSVSVVRCHPVAGHSLFVLPLMPMSSSKPPYVAILTKLNLQH